MANDGYIPDYPGVQCRPDDGLPCEESGCQKCCAHSEWDHNICIDCGYERDPGIVIDRAEMYHGDDR
jgi:hypothetical protein